MSNTDLVNLPDLLPATYCKLHMLRIVMISQLGSRRMVEPRKSMFTSFGQVEFCQHHNYICGVYIQYTQNICINFIQHWPNVFDVGPTLYNCYTNAGYTWLLNNVSYATL